jgi:hypothetical protein
MTAIGELANHFDEWEPHVRMKSAGAIPFFGYSDFMRIPSLVNVLGGATSESTGVSEKEHEEWVGHSKRAFTRITAGDLGFILIDLTEHSTLIGYHEPLIEIATDASESAFSGFGLSTENASEIESRPSWRVTGRTDVDARAVLWHVRNLDAAIEFARRSVSVEIAERLGELRNQPYDRDAGEEPLNLDSVRWFLDYCVRRGAAERPLMTVTLDGIMQGDWRQGKERRLTIRFYPDGMAWVAIGDGSSRGAWQEPARNLLTNKSIARIPDWA